MRKRRCTAADVILFVSGLGLHHRHHLAVQAVQLLICNAHALDKVVHLLNPQLSGAFQAQSFVGAHTVFDLRYKNHSQIFFASAA